MFQIQGIHLVKGLLAKELLFLNCDNPSFHAWHFPHNKKRAQMFNEVGLVETKQIRMGRQRQSLIFSTVFQIQTTSA